FNVEDGQDLVAVSNNKLVAIADSNLRITVLNLAIKKKVNLKLYLYSNYKPVIRAEFYNNKDFVMHPSREITNNNYCFFLNGSFKNSHNDKQSLTINNSISCGKIRDIEDYTTNKGKILLLDK
ncbi:13734_t:CDS:2, partial [Gigaspora rosea]